MLVLKKSDDKNANYRHAKAFYHTYAKSKIHLIGEAKNVIELVLMPFFRHSTDVGNSIFLKLCL